MTVPCYPVVAEFAQRGPQGSLSLNIFPRSKQCQRTVLDELGQSILLKLSSSYVECEKPCRSSVIDPKFFRISCWLVLDRMLRMIDPLDKLTENRWITQ